MPKCTRRSRQRSSKRHSAFEQAPRYFLINTTPQREKED
jgi:hypothetical protein